MKELGRVLGEGLLESLIDENQRQISTKVGKVVRETTFGKDGAFYYNQWIGERTSGGQEIVNMPDGKNFTRLYAGGVAKEEILEEIGMTGEDVVKQFKKFLQELGDKTRLFVDCYPKPDGDWTYQYSLLVPSNRFKNIPLTFGIETITKKIKVEKLKGSDWQEPTHMDKIVLANAIILTTVE